MNTVVPMSLDVFRRPLEIGSLGQFFDDSALLQLQTQDDERLIAMLVREIHRLLLKALDERTAKEFVKTRDKLFPKYVRALRALASTAENLVPDDDTVPQSMLADLERNIEKQRATRLGDLLADQSTFTLWTLGKIRELSIKIGDAVKVNEKDQEKDLELFRNYYYSSLFSQFHLDMIIASIKYDKRIFDGIRPEICDGLRASVNAYAIIKEAYLLRHPNNDSPNGETLPWDAEDEVLLRSSMRDVDNSFGT